MATNLKELLPLPNYLFSSPVGSYVSHRPNYLRKKNLCYHRGTKYRYLQIYSYLNFREISEILENIGGYFDKNIGNAKINKNTLKFMEILC